MNQIAVDPNDGHITHPVLLEGQIWSKKEATVEVARAADMREKAVFLNLSKREVSQLPAVAVKRRKK